MKAYTRSLEENAKAVVEQEEFSRQAPEINAKIAELQKKVDELLVYEGLANAKFADAQRTVNKALDKAYEQHEPELRKEFEAKKQDLQKVIDYVYNDLYLRYQLYFTEPGEENLPKYMEDTDAKIEAIKKMLNSDYGFDEDLFKDVARSRRKGLIEAMQSALSQK